MADVEHPPEIHGTDFDSTQRVDWEMQLESGWISLCVGLALPFASERRALDGIPLHELSEIVDALLGRFVTKRDADVANERIEIRMALLEYEAAVVVDLLCSNTTGVLIFFVFFLCCLRGKLLISMSCTFGLN